MGDPILGHLYKTFKININKISSSLNDLIVGLKVDYVKLLNEMGKFSYMLYPKAVIDKILMNAYKNGKEGDIISIDSRRYYIYGRNRRLSLIQFMQNPDGNVFPKEGLNMIKYYNIHQLEDMDNIYPDHIFRWIEIPKQYFPPQLFDVKVNSLFFIINNKDGIDDYGYKNLPIIPLDIGDEYKHIIYLSIPRESKYFEEFIKKPTKI